MVSMKLTKIEHEIESVSISNDTMIDSEREKAKPKIIKRFISCSSNRQFKINYKDKTIYK